VAWACSIRLEIAGQVLLIDPWLDGNPLFPGEKRETCSTA
jgi:L-ascorbate metabolism protein UlaG (beta-lactamase superfamily)